MATADYMAALRTILVADPLRWHALALVRSLALPDAWVGAGFVRNAVWDHLHHRPVTKPSGDVDVLWFDPRRADPAVDRQLQVALRSLEPRLDWSVKNQARMHIRNGDKPYACATDAIRGWPETATAVAVRRTLTDGCVVAAPFGLHDLFSLVLRPTERFATEKYHIYLNRIESKQWPAIWPRLQMKQAETGAPATAPARCEQ